MTTVNSTTVPRDRSPANRSWSAEESRWWRWAGLISVSAPLDNETFEPPEWLQRIVADLEQSLDAAQRGTRL
jgi:hypothetical protein